jgi:alpha-ketoglutarate-dependent taurine dioxygenase
MVSTAVESAATEAVTLRIQPFTPDPGSETDFGAEVTACDLAHLSEADFAALEQAVLTHHVVVVRGQSKLLPKDQFELTRRFDPTVQTYGHGHRKDILRQSVLVQDLVSIPDVPQVQLLGNGRVADHEGVPEVELRHPSHHGFHHTPLTAAQEAEGHYRSQCRRGQRPDERSRLGTDGVGRPRLTLPRHRSSAAVCRLLRSRTSRSLVRR